MNTHTSVSDIFNQISNSCYICQKPIKKPVAVLEYDHILHFNCAIEFFAIGKNITCPVKNCQNRIKNIEAVEKDIGNLAEALKPGNTPKRNVVRAKKEVVLSYYQFRKADAEKLKELLKISIPLRTAQSKIVAEVKKLLSSGTSINVIKRRIATAQKIYDIFSTIGEDKIQRIRNFSASSIGAFKKDEIEFIKTGDNKSKFRIERKSSNIWTDFNVLQSNDPKGLNS
ncbi:24316_t:CDS:2, partial [Racocetra persica]